MKKSNQSLYLGQPRAFYPIFFVEVWERFGFYGVQALIVLFMVQSLGHSDEKADFLFTAFTALVFLFPALGGYVGDHLLGTKRTILLGAGILTLGYFLLSFSIHNAEMLNYSLATIAVGNGLFKANPSSLLSKVYKKMRVNQDGGFTLYYMAINIGSFLSLFLVPIINQYFGWQIAFLTSGLGMMLAVANYLSMKRYVGDVGSEPDFKKMVLGRFIVVIGAAILLILVSAWLLGHHNILNMLLIFAAIVLFSFFFFQATKATSDERKGMLLFVVLFLQAIVFFVLYFQVPTSMTLFVLRNVSHSILGMSIQPGAFQGLSSFWILVMSPVLAMVYNKLSEKNMDLMMPTKFALGTLLAGIAFLVLPLGSVFATSGIVNSFWVVLSYFFQSIGELLVSALGMSLVSRYVPQRLMGYTMGLWFLSVSLSSMIAGYVASIAAIPTRIDKDPLISLPIYSHLFLEIGIVTVIIALIMFCFSPLLKRLIVEPKPRSV
jgi:proton-dependent oligopeptide transporter, POT family